MPQLLNCGVAYVIREKEKRRRVKRMTGKKFLSMTMVLWILATLAMINVPVQASPMVRIYVNMPAGYIPGVPVGGYVFVDLYIETDIPDNTPGGIVQWAISVKVDPAVLEPVMARGAMGGYFLYDFLVRYMYDWMGYSTGPIMYTVDKAAGIITWITEGIVGPTPIANGAGDGLYTPYKLVSLAFISKSATEYSPIDLFYEVDVDAYYWTAESGNEAFPADIVEDGHYASLPPVPEFPLGSVAPIALIAAIAYIWWVTKRKTREAM